MTDMANKTIVIGAGRMGASIARYLNEKSNVVIVDRNMFKIEKLQDYTGFCEVGDATDLQFLEKIGAKEANRVVIVTEDDNVNIFLADLFKNIIGVKDIYIRLKDSRKRKVVDDSVICICPFDLSLDYFENENGKKEA